ncbi:MAG: hypothetical protein BGO49_01480 [Planctomycetales bacterium 71-10]|nr:MAG: hypothetical protein BGO49_01480 [Planctomycetales bacterium 71-10]
MKDSPTQAVFPGYVVPALLSLLAFVNLWTGGAYWPKRRSGISVFTDGWRVSGSILLELGVAAGLFAWYVLANDDRRESLAQPVLGASILAAVAGLGLFGYGFWVAG